MLNDNFLFGWISSAQESDLAPIFVDLTPSENLSEINPPLLRAILNERSCHFVNFTQFCPNFDTIVIIVSASRLMTHNLSHKVSHKIL